MKYYILAACIALMGGITVWVSQSPTTETVRNEKADWKYYAVETETSVRPAHFEEMKWSPEAAVEMRAPASETKKKKKKN
jgi:hypothetical protein